MTTHRRALDQSARRTAYWTQEQIRSEMMMGQRSKYNNRTVRVDNHTFASRAESQRYIDLKTMEAGGAIHSLTLQPKFILQEGFTDRTGTRIRPLTYKADFSYYEEGVHVVEDVKGVRTEAYKLKVKLLKKRYPDIDFREIPA